MRRVGWICFFVVMVLTCSCYGETYIAKGGETIREVAMAVGDTPAHIRIMSNLFESAGDDSALKVGDVITYLSIPEIKDATRYLEEVLLTASAPEKEIYQTQLTALENDHIWYRGDFSEGYQIRWTSILSYSEEWCKSHARAQVAEVVTVRNYIGNFNIHCTSEGMNTLWWDLN